MGISVKTFSYFKALLIRHVLWGTLPDALLAESIPLSSTLLPPPCDFLCPLSCLTLSFIAPQLASVLQTVSHAGTRMEPYSSQWPLQAWHVGNVHSVQVSRFG